MASFISPHHGGWVYDERSEHGRTINWHGREYIIIASGLPRLDRVGAPDEWRRNSASEMQRREREMEMGSATARPSLEHLLVE